MKNGTPAFSVIDGRPDTSARIALSLVHPCGRIDISVKDVIEIEARAEETFFFSDTWTSKSFPRAHVRLSFRPHIGTRIHRLTSHIVGQPLDVVVAGEVVASPIVREPGGLRENLSISVHDLDEAKRLAAKLREGWVVTDLRIV